MRNNPFSHQETAVSSSKGEGPFTVIAGITGVLALIVTGLQVIHEVYGVGPAPVTAAVDWIKNEGSSPGRQPPAPQGGSPSTPEPDDLPPDAPENLRIDSQLECLVTLGWDASIDDVGVENYFIYDGSSRAGQVGGEFTVYEVRLFPGQEANYTVQAVDGSGNESPLSNVLTVPPCSEVIPEDTEEPNFPSF
jgi:hypothetical protein